MLRAVTLAFTDLYLEVGADGTIVDCWARRESDLFAPRDQLLGRRVADALPPEVAVRIGDAVASACARGVATGLEYTVRRDGELLFFDGRAVPLEDAAVLVMVRDVTEQRRADAALHDAVQALRALVEATPLAVMTLDRSGIVTLWNPGAERLFGWGAAEVVGTPNPLVPPHHRAAGVANLQDRLRGGERVAGIEIRPPRKDGTLVDVSASAAPLRDARGAAVGSIAVFEDISERKRAEATLRSSEERYRQLFEASPQPMWVVDVETLGLLAVNDAAVRHYGYSRDEFLTMTLHDVHPADGGPAPDASVFLADDGARDPGVVRHRKRDGSTIAVEVTTHSMDFGGRKAKMALLQDVTERERLDEQRRQVESALRRSEERYRAFVQQSSEAIWCFETGAPVPVDLSEDEQIACFFRDAYLSECNDAMARLYSFASSADIEGTRLADLLDRGDARNEAMLRAFIGSGYRLSDVETHARDLRGEPRVLLNTLVGIVQDGRLLRAWGTQRDITAQRRAEDGLRLSEESLRSFVHNAVFGIYRSTRDGRVLMANQTLARLLGYDAAEQLLGLDIRTIYHDPDERERLIRRYGAADRYEALEATWRRRDGSAVPVRLSGRVLHDAGGAVAGFEGIVEDMSERRTLEQQLRQAQKMEAVGQLAGGMAHDFNNLLTTILTTAELADAELGPDSLAHHDLERIEAASRRGSDLIRKLLGFARRQRLSREPLDLNALVREFGGVLRRLVPEDIEIEQVLAEDAVVVRADQGAIEQVLMNLATNARDAMSRGGVLRVEIRHTALTAEACAELGWGSPGRYGELAVSDTGVGMDAETQLRLFEPFFTTKPVDVGTGLGLAMVYGLIKQHEGFVTVDSAVGRGTTVRVLLPLVAGAVRAAAPAARETPLHGSETILLVEDEDSLRSAATRVLQKHGYRVVAATNGTEALRLFREHEADVALIVADVVMPGLGGPQLIRELRRAGKRVKVLFTSGYTERDIQETKALDPDQPFLAKPWAVTDLLTRVREVLDRPDGS
jgi:two-component system cell cycle sensor histidine kinase/response regulator CckA